MGSGVEVGTVGVFVGAVVASASAGSDVGVGSGSGAGVPPQAVMMAARVKVRQRVLMVRGITKPPRGNQARPFQGANPLALQRPLRGIAIRP